jgi:hypothetical protein
MYQYKSIQEHYVSGSGVNSHGSRNVVVIKNNKGYKEHAKLGPSGSVIKKSRHTLKRKEVKAIANKEFVPNLWKCCSARKRTRKQRRA